MRRITIEFGENEYGGRHINVIDEYGRETGQLCFGEALEQVSSMIAAEIGLRPVPYAMHTPDELAERERRAEERRRARELAAREDDTPF